MSTKHKKHVDLVKPNGGKIGSNELAFIGAPCGIIQSVCQDIAQHLTSYSFGFIDADHSAAEEVPLFNRHYTDKISFHQLTYHQETMEYDFRQVMSKETMVLVNGNHFKAAQQVVFIHEKKKASLEKKLDRLTDVKFFILADEQDDIYDFLKEHNPIFDALPKVKLSDIDAITSHIELLIEASIPVVNGLVLAGGKSTRMGHDKSEIKYYGKPHKIHLADMLQNHCCETYISALGDSDNLTYPVIEDSFTNLGPFGGILSAFRSNPNVAWVTIATDVPFVNDATIQQLLQERDPQKFATCFHNPATGFPEPLVTLWEPKAYARLLYFLSLGYSCPRKVLINSEINELTLKDTTVLFNANTPEEMQAAMTKING